MIANKLHINMGKCSYMYFSPSKKFIKTLDYNLYPLYVADKLIAQVSETKFLGVVIDEKLTWLSHINYLSNISGHFMLKGR